VSIGYVVGLDYENPTLSPFEEFQRFKQHLLSAGYWKAANALVMAHERSAKAGINRCRA